MTDAKARLLQMIADEPHMGGGGLLKAVSKAQKTAKKAKMYSAVDKALEASKRGAGTGMEFANELSKTSGIKKAELIDRGIMVPSNNGPVLNPALTQLPKMTKQEFVSHLNEKYKPPGVKKITLGNVKFDQLSDQDLYNEYFRIRGSGPEAYGERMSREDILDELSGVPDEDATKAKYSQYKLPGSENYRENLYQYENPTGKAFYQSHFDEPNVLYHMRQADRIEPTYTNEQIYGIGQRMADAMGTKMENLGSGAPQMMISQGVISPVEAAQFSHAKGFRNMDIDMTPAQRRALHIEEIQSDWHQKGRKGGYENELAYQEARQKADEVARAAGYQDAFHAAEGWKGHGMESAKEASDMLDEASKFKSVNSVPDAPFKNNWHELALKQALMDAAEGDYDQLLITPGAEQAKRFDLTKVADAISYHPDDKGRGMFLNVFGKNNQIIYSKLTPESELPNVIGQETTQKLLAQAPDDGNRVLSGLDLELGGEGMAGFYDKMVPNYLNDIGKKYGVRVGERAIEGEVPYSKTTPTLADVQRLAQEMYGVSDLQAISALPLEQRNALNQVFADRVKAEHTTKLHTFDITPEMREDILNNGLPMYQRGGAVHMAGGGRTPKYPWERYPQPKKVPEMRASQITPVAGAIKSGADYATQLIDKGPSFANLVGGLVGAVPFVGPDLRKRMEASDIAIPTDFTLGSNMPAEDYEYGQPMQYKKPGISTTSVPTKDVLEALKVSDLVGTPGLSKVAEDVGYGQMPDPLDLLDAASVAALGYGAIKGGLKGGRKAAGALSNLAKSETGYKLAQKALEYVPGAQPMYAVKQKGGNWVDTEVKRHLDRFKNDEDYSPLLVNSSKQDLAEIEKNPSAYQNPAAEVEILRSDIAHMEQTNAFNKWVDSKAGSYVRNQMGTPDDPVVKSIDMRVMKAQADLEAGQKRLASLDGRIAEAEKTAVTPEELNQLEGMKRNRSQRAAELQSNYDLTLDTMLPGGKSNEGYQYLRDSSAYLKANRRDAGFPAAGLAQTRPGKAWEAVTDAAIGSNPADMYQNQGAKFLAVENAQNVYNQYRKEELPERFRAFVNNQPDLSPTTKRNFINNADARVMASTLGELDRHEKLVDDIYQARQKADSDAFEGAKNNPYLNKLAPETPVYTSLGLNELGIDHVIDVLKQDIAAGNIKLEDLNKITMEQALKRASEYDLDLAKKARDSLGASRAAMPVYKEYPEGYRWVQLTKPGEFRQESEEMGHSVKGYEPPKGHPDWSPISENSGSSMYGHGGWEAIKSGKAKVYSLVDANHKPHVTIEVKTKGVLSDEDFGANDARIVEGRGDFGEKGYRTTDNQFFETYSDAVAHEKIIQRPTLQELQEPPTITQIKGKGNARPAPKYDQYTQDFVQSGKWADVGDIKNAGLRRTSDAFNENELNKIRAAGIEVPTYATQEEIKSIGNQAFPGQYGDVPYAEGGEVKPFFEEKSAKQRLLDMIAEEPHMGIGVRPSRLQLQGEIANDAFGGIGGGGRATYTHPIGKDAAIRAYIEGGGYKPKDEPYKGQVNNMGISYEKEFKDGGEVYMGIGGAALKARKVAEAAEATKKAAEAAAKAAKVVPTPAAPAFIPGLTQKSTATEIGRKERARRQAAAAAEAARVEAAKQTPVPVGYVKHTEKSPNPHVGYRYEATQHPGIAQPIPIDLAKLEREKKGASLGVMPWDSQSRNVEVSSISGEPLQTHLYTHAGQPYALDEKHLAKLIGGASAEEVTDAIKTRDMFASKENRERGGTGEVVHAVTTMGQYGENYSHPPSDFAFEIVNRRRQEGTLKDKDLQALNNSIRTFQDNKRQVTQGIFPYANFAGFETPEGLQQIYTGGLGLSTSSGNLRKAIAKRLHKVGTQELLGFNSEDLINATTVPSLRGVDKGYLGGTLLSNDIGNAGFYGPRKDRFGMELAPAEGFPYNSPYSTDFSARYYGQLPDLVPLDVVMHRQLAPIEQGLLARDNKKPYTAKSLRNSAIGSLEKSNEGVSQIMDARFFQDLADYFDALNKPLEKKKGGLAHSKKVKRHGNTVSN
jgi:hypothetical protein